MISSLETTLQSSLWQDLRLALKNRLHQEVFETWFSSIDCIEAREDFLCLEVPNDFASIWIQDNYLDLIIHCVRAITGQLTNVELKVKKEEQSLSSSSLEKASSSRSQEVSSHLNESHAGGIAQRRSRLNTEDNYLFNPRNTFKTFVVGPGNQLAHAASVAVANAPAKAYNPLFLYGETGLGKTHLMHAVGQQVLAARPGAKVAYISTEKFTNEFIRAIQENSLVKFRQRYRSVDVLLVDDIHFLSGKERIQEEFFHTFNDLFESQKQILLTSDRPAGEIAKLENRLISRFQWGLVTDIQVPDLETRVAILRTKAAAMNLSLPTEILDFLAESVSKNVRRMEGALTRVASYAALLNAPLTVRVVERLLQDILQEEAKNQVTIEKIQERVVEYFHLRPSDMVSKKRPANIAFPRQIAMYLCRTLTQHALNEIGEAFGGRDHGTVIHACKTVENMMEQDESVRRSVEYLHKQLGRRG